MEGKLGMKRYNILLFLTNLKELSFYLIYIVYQKIIISMRTYLLFALLFIICFFKAEATGTKITFFVQHEVNDDKDYMEIVIDIKAQDTSLKEALENAEETVQYIRNLIEQNCKVNSQKKGECQQITQSGKFSVDPLYRIIQGEPVFIAFAATYEVTGKIIHPDFIGPLIDRINRRAGTHIRSLQWKDLDEDDEQMAAVGEGLEQAEKRCSNLRLSLGQIESIEEVAKFQLEEEPAEDEEKKQQEEDEGPEIITYKFVVQCIGKQQPKKKEK